MGLKAESEEELKSLLRRVKEKSEKSGLKLKIPPWNITQPLKRIHLNQF